MDKELIYNKYKMIIRILNAMIMVFAIIFILFGLYFLICGIIGKNLIEDFGGNDAIVNYLSNYSDVKDSISDVKEIYGNDYMSRMIDSLSDILILIFCFFGAIIVLLNTLAMVFSITNKNRIIDKSPEIASFKFPIWGLIFSFISLNIINVILFAVSIVYTRKFI